MAAIERSGSVPVPTLELDAAQIGAALGVAPSQVQVLIDEGTISVLCERGTGEDLGLSRITFYYRRQRLRLLVDHTGRVLESG